MSGLPEIETRFGPYLRLKGEITLCVPIIKEDGGTDVLLYPLDALNVARLMEDLGQAAAQLLRSGDEAARAKPGQLSHEVRERIRAAAMAAA